MQYQLTTTQVQNSAGLAGMGTGMLIFYLAIMVVMIAAIWKIFTKAGKPGWASIIPIYDVIVLIQVAGLEWWYILLLLVPLANIYAIFKIYIELAHKFGKSTGFGVLTVFFSLICLPILGFGDAKYQGAKESKKKE